MKMKLEFIEDLISEDAVELEVRSFVQERIKLLLDKILIEGTLNYREQLKLLLCSALFLKDDIVYKLMKLTVEDIEDSPRVMDKEKKAIHLLFLGWLYRQGLYVEKNLARGTRYIDQALALEDKKSRGAALCLKGMMYCTGNGSEKNTEKAINYLHQAAKLGDSSALYFLSECYLKGIGVAQDKRKAIQYLDKAVVLEHPNAIFNLAVYYAKGIFGIDPDRNKAIELYQRVAALGDSQALLTLSDYYHQGIHVRSNEKKAIGYLQRAAALGNAIAVFNLAVRYSEGMGLVKDEHKAVAYYQIAAELKYIGAITNLAICYSEGTGVAQDNKKAFEGFQKAADLGDVKALCMVGIYHYEGREVEENWPKALGCLNDSFLKGFPNKRAITDLFKESCLTQNSHKFTPKVLQELTDNHWAGVLANTISPPMVHLLQEKCSLLFLHKLQNHNPKEIGALETILAYFNLINAVKPTDALCKIIGKKNWNNIVTFVKTQKDIIEMFMSLIINHRQNSANTFSLSRDMSSLLALSLFNLNRESANFSEGKETKRCITL